MNLLLATKAEMAENLFEKLGVSKRDAKDLVEAFFEEVRRSLENGEQVKLSGFGNFELVGTVKIKEGRKYFLSDAFLNYR